MLLFGIALAAEPTAPPPVVDATRLVSLLPLESTALGGAGIGFASGAIGMFFQPAAPANRKVENLAPLTVSLAFNRRRLGFAPSADIENLGELVEGKRVATNLGVAAGWRNAGIGATVSSLDHAWARGNSVVTEGRVGGSGAFFDGRLAVGAGWRLLSFRANVDDDTATFTGSGFEAGFAVNRPLPGLNLGGVFRGPLRAERTSGDLELDVEGALVPWQASLGVGWFTPAEPRSRPVRVVADVVVDGPVTDGVSLDSILVGEPRTRGASLSVTPRAGVELTVWPERIRVRVGTYLEPARVADARPRLHGTTGLELRLFHFDIFGIAGDLSWRAAVDVAPRYLDVGFLGIGFWMRGVTGSGWSPPDVDPTGF